VFVVDVATGIVTNSGQINKYKNRWLGRAIVLADGNIMFVGGNGRNFDADYDANFADRDITCTRRYVLNINTFEIKRTYDLPCHIDSQTCIEVDGQGIFVCAGNIGKTAYFLPHGGGYTSCDLLFPPPLISGDCIMLNLPGSRVLVLSVTGDDETNTYQSTSQIYDLKSNTCIRGPLVGCPLAEVSNHFIV
jgi:hypothetical protein